MAEGRAYYYSWVVVQIMVPFSNKAYYCSWVVVKIMVPFGNSRTSRLVIIVVIAMSGRQENGPL